MKAIEKPFEEQARFFLSITLSGLVFFVGMQKYATNDVIMMIWERDIISNPIHGLFHVGHKDQLNFVFPTAVVGLLSAIMVVIVPYKNVFRFPSDLNAVFFGYLVADYLALSVLVNIFIFSGTGFELLYYAGAFLAGAIFFGNNNLGRWAMLIALALVIIRLIYVQDLYPYVYLIPLMLLVYGFLRSPFDASGFLHRFKDIGA